MAMMIDDRCVVDHWLVVLNNVVLVHWLVVLDNGVLIHWLVVLNNRVLIHWLVVLNNRVLIHWLVVLDNSVLVHWLVVLHNGVLVHWLVVLNRCRNNRGMSIKWLVRDRHMICDTLRLLCSITITRKGNNIGRSHVATYMNFPHAGNKSNFLNCHRVRH